MNNHLRSGTNAIVVTCRADPLTGAGAGAGQTIQLPLDHFGEDAGAISVRYWVDTQFWSPGGPVLYMMGGAPGTDSPLLASRGGHYSCNLTKDWTRC
jgi:hypothetical protein